MDVIQAMTCEERIQLKEQAERLLRSIELSQLNVHVGEASFDFYPAEVHGSSRKRNTKKKAELRTTQDAIGLTSLPLDIKLNDAETSINIHLVDPTVLLTELRQAIANTRLNTATTRGVKSLKVIGGRRNRGKPKHTPFYAHMHELIRITLSPNVLAMACYFFASVCYIYRRAEFLNQIRELGVEEILCRDCYAKNVFSFFQQSFFYLFVLASIFGHACVAALIVWFRSIDTYPRFTALEALRIFHNFLFGIYYYYTLPHAWRMSLTPSLFKAKVWMHFHDVVLVLLLLWNSKHNAGFKGLMRNAFGALLISIAMTSTYFYCLSALHEKLVPGVDFHGYLDIERGFIEATEGLYDLPEGTWPPEALEHMDM